MSLIAVSSSTCLHPQVPWPLFSRALARELNLPKWKSDPALKDRQLNEIKQALDADGDGTISAKEYNVATQKLGLRGFVMQELGMKQPMMQQPPTMNSMGDGIATDAINAEVSAKIAAVHAKAAVKAATQAAKEQIRDSLKLNRSLTDTAAGYDADWTQPYAKITAEELEGCYVCACFPAVMFYGTGRHSRTCAPRASQNARTLVCAQNGGMTNPHHVLHLLGVGMFKRSAEGPDTYVDAGVILYCSSLKFVHT